MFYWNMPVKIITDKMILQLLEEYKNTHGITMKDTCKKLGVHIAILANIRSGRQSFTQKNILDMEKLYPGINFNYLYGKEKNLLRKPPVNPIDLIEEGVRQLKKRRKS